MANIKKSSVLDALNLTPLIDVVFLLLIFFTVATRFASDEREMSVVLPQASEAKPLIESPQEIFVNVDQNGRFIVNRTALSEGQLLTLLKQRESNNPGRQSVIIRGDKRCPWEYMATAMNVCNQAKIHDYRVSIAPEEGQP